MAALAGAAVISHAAHAQDGEDGLPDLEFLEYLGSWAEDDEEWFVEAEIEQQETPEEMAGETSDDRADDDIEGSDDRDRESERERKGRTGRE